MREHHPDRSAAAEALAAELRSRAPQIATLMVADWREGHLSGTAGDRAADISRTVQAATLAVAEQLRSMWSSPPVDRPTEPADMPPSGDGQEAGPAGWDVPGLVGVYLAWRGAMRAVLVEAPALAGIPGALDEANRVVEEVADRMILRAATHLESVRRRLETQLLRQQSRLEHQALHDPLTGLANRALIVDRLRHSLRSAARRQSRPAVIALDLDHFKAVNDTCGHTAGDQLLLAVGGRLGGLVRPGDTLGRLDGDEFVVVCDELCDPGPESLVVAERILSSFAQPFDVAGQQLFVTASVGVAATEIGEDADELVAMASQAMDRAKQSGGSRVACYDPGVDREASRRSQIITGLHRAIERNELRLVYQPILGVGSPWVLAREALLRWRHPVLGDVPPDEFIPIAEQIGVIGPLGRWVLRQACAECAAWQAGAERHVGVAVNVSGRQFEEATFADSVESILGEVGVGPASLTLEITESQLVADRPRTVAMLQRLRGAGVRVAVDDFGTGYSSLSWLARLPIDILKIDRSFVASLDQASGRETAIVQTMIRLAHTLGLTVVAEGVETGEQLATLVRLGCDLAQGFLLGRPQAINRSEHAA